MHKFEIIGYVVFGFGVYLMFTDPFAVKSGGGGDRLWGNLIPFIGAGMGAILGYINSSKYYQLHPLVRMAQYFLFGVFYQLIFSPLFIQDNEKYYSFDPEYGAFGWLGSWSNFFNVLFLVSPITGVLGNIGYLTSYKYFPMQIVAAAILTEPFIGQTSGILLGQDEIPGFKTALGLCIITAGFVIASYGVAQKQKEELRRILDESHISKCLPSLLCSQQRV